MEEHRGRSILIQRRAIKGPPIISRNKSPEGAREYLARGLNAAKCGDAQKARANLRLALNAGREMRDGEAAISAAVGLALLAIERDDLTSAYDWLACAQTVELGAPGSPLVGLVGLLSGLITMQVTADKALNEIENTRTRVLDEFHLVRTDVGGEKARAWRLLLERDDASPPSKSPTASSPPKSDRKAVINVRLLGPFRAQLIDGTELKLCANRKGQAIFKLLVTLPDSKIYKHILLESLWPDEDPAVATRKLHISISRLRQALQQTGLGPDPIVLDDDFYRLGPSLEIRQDLTLFDAHLRAGRRFEIMEEPDMAAAEYLRALELYTGPYLSDDIGEDWMTVERARVEEEYLFVLSKIAVWHFEKGRHSSCIEICRRILEIDELREDIQRLLMRALNRIGKRNQALLTYRDLMELLRRELGVEPMRSTTELVDRIRREEKL